MLTHVKLEDSTQQGISIGFRFIVAISITLSLYNNGSKHLVNEFYDLIRTFKFAKD